MPVLPGWTGLETTFYDPTVLRVVRATLTKVKTRKVAKIPNMGPGIELVVPDNNLLNGVRALAERILRVKGPDGLLVLPPAPVDGLVFVRRFLWLKRLLRKQCKFRPSRSSEIQFLSCYLARRRAVYEQAAETLKMKPLRKSDAHVKFFVKAENTNITAKPDPVFRGISPRGPRYCIELGRYTRPLEAVIYQTLNDIAGHPSIAKGLNAAAVGRLFEEKWNTFVNPVAIGLDASRFDQHVNRQALEWEHSVYLMLFGGSLEDRSYLKWLLSLQLRNKIFANFEDGKLRTSVEGVRMSGDMNTALGNVLIMVALVMTYAKERDIKIRFMNNGDDVVVILEDRDQERFSAGLKEWFLEFGFNMKVEDPVYDIEKIEFCQTHPIWTPDGYIMVRDHIIGRAKDVSTFKINNIPECETWMTCVGTGGMRSNGGIPVFQEFYASLKRAGRGRATVKGVFDEQNGRAALWRDMDRSYSDIHPKTRFSYWLAFGITPRHQELIEEYYRSYTPYATKLVNLISVAGKQCSPSGVWEGLMGSLCLGPKLLKC